MIGDSKYIVKPILIGSEGSRDINVITIQRRSIHYRDFNAVFDGTFILSGGQVIGSSGSGSNAGSLYIGILLSLIHI